MADVSSINWNPSHHILKRNVVQKCEFSKNWEFVTLLSRSTSNRSGNSVNSTLDFLAGNSRFNRSFLSRCCLANRAIIAAIIQILSHWQFMPLIDQSKRYPEHILHSRNLSQRLQLMQKDCNLWCFWLINFPVVRHVQEKWNKVYQIEFINSKFRSFYTSKTDRQTFGEGSHVVSRLGHHVKTVLDEG